MKLGIIPIALMLGTLPVYAQIGDLLKTLGVESKDESKDEKAGSGLKEVLRIGTEKAVLQTGQLDGYFANEAIKILLPDNVQKMDRALRMVGFGPQIDEFVLSMNRAAEKAAPFAKDIFWGAIQEMTFVDAAEIVRGDDTAATQYFREKTSDQLREAFRPIVHETMQETGVTRHYGQLVERFNAIPFMKSDSADIDEYVLDKALDGLFHVVGEQEKQIRTNPAARVTDLLKEIFG